MKTGGLKFKIRVVILLFGSQHYFNCYDDEQEDEFLPNKARIDQITEKNGTSDIS